MANTKKSREIGAGLTPILTDYTDGSAEVQPRQKIFVEDEPQRYNFLISVISSFICVIRFFRKSLFILDNYNTMSKYILWKKRKRPASIYKKRLNI